MKKFLILLSLFSMNTFAAWQVEVALGVDGQTWKIDNAKFDDGKETAITLGKYLVKMTIKKSKEENFILVNKGDEIIESGQASNEIFAKGEAKQPNTIITLKLKNI